MYVDSEMDGYQVKEICSVLCEPTDVHLDYSYLLRDHERTLIKHLELFFRTFFYLQMMLLMRPYMLVFTRFTRMKSMCK